MLATAEDAVCPDNQVFERTGLPTPSDFPEVGLYDNEAALADFEVLGIAEYATSERWMLYGKCGVGEEKWHPIEIEIAGTPVSSLFHDRLSTLEAIAPTPTPTPTPEPVRPPGCDEEDIPDPNDCPR